MTLLAFMQACTTNKMSVTISDAAGEIITFNSEGYEGVESDILAREVTSWNVTNKGLNVTLSSATKPAGTLTLSKNSVSLASVGDDDTVTVTAATGAVTAESSDSSVATVAVDTTGTDPVITITEVAAGTATITVTSAETAQYQAATDTIAVTCAV